MNQRQAIFSKWENDNRQPHINESWNFHNEYTQCHLHALHPYAAKFIPQIPRKAILSWAKEGDTVLDPFCGCGTTLLESILLCRPAIGVDNNAVACLVSQAKTAPYTHGDLRTLNEFLNDLNSNLRAPQPEVWSPDYPQLDYWFSKAAIHDLGVLSYAVDQLSDPARLLALSVFSSIIVRASYQDRETRYTRVSRLYSPGSAYKWFKLRLNDAIDRLNEIIDLPKAECQVIQEDSRDLASLKNSSVDFIVTSPPYLNAYDYHKYHRHRLHWIKGDVGFARDLEIGKHDVFTRPNANPDIYFRDLKKCFAEWHRVLSPDSYALVVIGDAIVGGKPIAVGDRFIELADEIGLTCEDHWIRDLNKLKKSFNQGARITAEHVLLFKKA
jgi:DNA modification methylase